MLLALSLVPVPLIRKFLPLNSFNPTLKNYADAHGHKSTFHLDNVGNLKCNHVHRHTQDFKWENDRENLCNYFADCDIKNTFDRLIHVAECYMFSQLPGRTVRATLQSREGLWGSRKR